MLPIVLVLLVATSALAAPGVNLSIRNVNEVVPPRHNGRAVSAFLTNQAFENIDGGDTVPYVLNFQQVVDDLANQGDKSSQALAAGQVIAILGSLSTGIPGDACAPANFIDSYVASLRNGNSVAPALGKFVGAIKQHIDQIVQYLNNPNQLKNAVGPRGNCNGGGRNYQFEAAWDAILSNASGASAGLVNEQYCAAKRLYSAFGLQSSSLGAYVTAVSLPPVNRVLQDALEPVAKFVASLSSGNYAAAAAGAKNALDNALRY
uniref:Fibroin light chain n=1 Tax=Heliothis virescens TaxID=7102 RepID=A0A2A4JXS4_HELVI